MNNIAKKFPKIIDDNAAKNDWEWKPKALNLKQLLKIISQDYAENVEEL
jgi:hypothetical protein